MILADLSIYIWPQKQKADLLIKNSGRYLNLSATVLYIFEFTFGYLFSPFKLSSAEQLRGQQFLRYAQTLNKMITKENIAVTVYTIKNHYYSKYLNIPSTSTMKSGTTINVFAETGHNDQRWVINDVTSTSQQPIMHYSSPSLMVGASGTQCVLSSTTNQVVLTKKSSNIYTIKHASSGLYLEAASDGSVSWKAATGSNMQNWQFTAQASALTTNHYAVATDSTTPFSAFEIKTNANYIRAYLMTKGFTKNAACGILGNMYAESKCNPGNWERGHLRDPRGGYGLVQWTNASYSSTGIPNGFLVYAAGGLISNQLAVAELDDLASSNPKRLLDSELNYLISSMEPSQRLFYYDSRYDNSGVKNMTFADFKASTLGADTLALVFHDYYERSNSSKATLVSGRATPALNYYNTGSFT